MEQRELVPKIRELCVVLHATYDRYESGLDLLNPASGDHAAVAKGVLPMVREIEKGLEENVVSLELLPFNDVELTALLEVSRVALADAEIADDIGEKMDLTADALVDLHEKVVKFLEEGAPS